MKKCIQFIRFKAGQIISYSVNIVHTLTVTVAAFLGILCSLIFDFISRAEMPKYARFRPLRSYNWDLLEIFLKHFYGASIGHKDNE